MTSIHAQPCPVESAIILKNPKRSLKILDKWDKSEGNKDKIFDLATKFLENMDKQQSVIKINMSFSVTPEKAKQIAEILEK